MTENFVRDPGGLRERMEAALGDQQIFEVPGYEPGQVLPVVCIPPRAGVFQVEVVGGGGGGAGFTEINQWPNQDIQQPNWFTQTWETLRKHFNLWVPSTAEDGATMEFQSEAAGSWGPNPGILVDPGSVIDFDFNFYGIRVTSSASNGTTFSLTVLW